MLKVSDTAARFDLATRTWSPISLSLEIESRAHHSAVLVGSEIILWGGGRGAHALGDGGAFDFETHEWRPIDASVGTPSPRLDACAVWTWTEMIIFGGHNLR